MAEKKPVKYLGSGKEQFFNSGDSVVNCSIPLHKVNKADIIEGVDNNGEATKYLHIVVQKNKDGENKYGSTHSIKLNQWRLDKDAEKKAQAGGGESGVDLPFG